MSSQHSDLRVSYERDIGAVQRQLPSYAPTFETLWQRYLDLLDEGLRLEEQLQAERREEWREGIVNVLDHEGNYLGCMGSETWAWTLDGGIKRMKEQLQAAEEAAQRNWDEHVERQLKALDVDPERKARLSAERERDGLLDQLEAWEKFLRANPDLRKRFDSFRAGMAVASALQNEASSPASRSTERSGNWALVVPEDSDPAKERLS